MRLQARKNHQTGIVIGARFVRRWYRWTFDRIYTEFDDWSPLDIQIDGVSVLYATSAKSARPQLVPLPSGSYCLAVFYGPYQVPLEPAMFDVTSKGVAVAIFRTERVNLRGSQPADLWWF